MAGPRVRSAAAQQDDRGAQGAGRDHDLPGTDAEGPYDLGRQATLVQRQETPFHAHGAIAFEEDPVDRCVDQEPRAVVCGDGQVTADPRPLGPDATAEGAATTVAAAGGVALVGRRLVAQRMAALDEQPVLGGDRLDRADPQLGPDAREVGVRLRAVEALEAVVARPALADRRGRVDRGRPVDRHPAAQRRPGHDGDAEVGRAGQPSVEEHALEAGQLVGRHLGLRPGRACLDHQHRAPSRRRAGSHHAAAGAAADDDDVGLELEPGSGQPRRSGRPGAVERARGAWSVDPSVADSPSDPRSGSAAGLPPGPRRRGRGRAA